MKETMNKDKIYKLSCGILSCVCLLLGAVLWRVSQEHAKYKAEYNALLPSADQAEEVVSEAVVSAPATKVENSDKSAKELRRLKRRNSSEAEVVENSFHTFSMPERIEITLEELEQKDPESFQRFLEIQKHLYKSIQVEYEDKKRLLENLNPEWLPPEEFAMLQDEFQRKLAEDEAKLQFKRPPLPEGMFYDENDAIRFISQPTATQKTYRPFDRSILEKYAVNAAGIEDPKLLEYAKLWEGKGTLQPPMFVKPIIVEKKQ